MVHPLGVVTLSISDSGWFFDFNNKDEAPFAVCAAIVYAVSESNPISIPP